MEPLKRDSQGRLRQRKVGSGSGQLLPLLKDLECRRLAAPIAELRHIGELLVRSDLLLDDRQLLSGGHRVEVCFRYLGSQRQSDRVTVSAARVCAQPV